MDYSKEFLEDRINLKIEIKEENDVQSSTLPETVPIKEEPWLIDSNKIKPDPDCLDFENESNYFVTENELRGLTNIKTEDFHINSNDENDAAFELVEDRGWEEDIKGKVKHIDENTTIGSLYGIKHEDVEIKSEENYGDTPLRNLKEELDDHSSAKTNDSKLKHKTKRDRSKDKHMSVSQKQMYQCDLCDYKSIYKRYVAEHQLVHQTDKQEYKCDLCDYKTIYKKSLIQHEKRHKGIPEEQMHKCDFCDYKAIFKNYVTKHQLKHTEQMFKCDSCDFKTVYKDYLKKHQLKHTSISEQYKCESCNYKTVFKQNLTKHLLIHKDISEEQMFKCDWCEYKTSQKLYLKRHEQRRHSSINKKPQFYKCESCDFKTGVKDYLARHQLRHKEIPEEQMFKCDWCEYKTGQKIYLKRHKQRRHSSIPKKS